MFSTDDTIVAIATPPGRGGIGIVRLAGPDAHRIAQSLTGRTEPFTPRHATLTRVVGSAPFDEAQGALSPGRRAGAKSPGEVIDQTVVTLFAKPHSYTGDDVVEISAHGSPILLERIVELACGAGARLAEPGEFTLRAYLNGRVDLAQAEAVADLVDAVTPLQARAAMDQLEGTLTSVIGRIDSALFDLSARLEASLDFPEEGFHFITREEAGEEVVSVRRELERLARDGRAGRVVREGRLVVIAGPPNAGKSSLFNALVGSARAIVTDVPGTTRDVLTERVDLDGVPITLVDTAGLRDAGDAIEAEGIKRALQAQTIAAMTMVVVDASVPLPAEYERLFADARTPQLVVINKVDLPRAWTRADLVVASSKPVVEVSAVNGAGLDELRHALIGALTEREELRDPPAISNIRHLALVHEALTAVERAESALREGATEELVLADLAAARRALEEITGRRTPEDLLRHIFARFCVGK